MNIVILTVGTRGDVEPYIALGMGLARAGYAVRLATHDAFREAVLAAGLDFAPLPGDPRRLLAELEPDLAKVERNTFGLMRRIGRTIGPGLTDLVRDAETACRGADVILYRDLLFALGYSLAEAMNVRPVVASLVPRAPTRAFAFPRALPFGGIGNLLSYRVAQQVLWQMLRKGTNRWRTTHLGLPPLPFRGPFADGKRRQTLGLSGFSEVVVPRPSDWPLHDHITGFWSMPIPDEWQPPPALVKFLAAGPPPVYVGFGSLPAGDAEYFTALVGEALARAGRRGVLATAWGGLIASVPNPGDRLFVVDAVSHAWLFPRVSAVVHHGGIGTSAAGLRAGRPSIVVPSYGDQFFWADRVANLGAGPKPIPRRKLTVARLAEAIEIATTDQAMQRQAAELGERLRLEDGVGAAVDALNRHIETDAWRWDRQWPRNQSFVAT
jgi:sterol 3beta-glucosyltransferase